MRNKILLLIGLGLLLNIFFVANVFAQNEPKDQPKRVIEEELVLKDPTVAAEKKWLVGGSYEFWYVGGPYKRFDSAGVKIADGNVSGIMNGGNIVVGYDNFTLQYSYRAGSWDIDFDYSSSGAHTKQKQDQGEHEVTLRYLIKPLALKHFVPYVLAGYNYTSKKDTETIENNFFWNYTPAVATHKVKVLDRTYSSPLVGMGAIVPFNNYIGIRGDARLMFTSAEMKRDDGATWSDSGLSGAVVGTLYWNIWEGLNLQVGGKWLYLNGGDKVGYDSKVGGFVMLGYVYKF
jgi:hypothetical protein